MRHCVITSQRAYEDEQIYFMAVGTIGALKIHQIHRHLKFKPTPLLGYACVFRCIILD